MLNIRQFYLVLVSVTVLIISCIGLVHYEMRRSSQRKPEDVVRMEQVRRATLDDLGPLRDRIHVDPMTGHPSIRVTHTDNGEIAVAVVDESERELAIEILDSARDNIRDTDEINEGEASVSKEAQFGASRLFSIKDYLWELTFAYIQLLREIYAGDREVTVLELISLENQLEDARRKLEEELLSFGLTVEQS